MAVTNFPLISQVEGSRGTTLFALDVLRTPRYCGIGTGTVAPLVLPFTAKRRGRNTSPEDCPREMYPDWRQYKAILLALAGKH